MDPKHIFNAREKFTIALTAAILTPPMHTGSAGWDFLFFLIMVQPYFFVVLIIALMIKWRGPMN